SSVVATIMSNGALKEFLNKHGIELDTCNVGDKYVLEKLKANGGNFGGEQSGHIIFSDYAKTGDGLIAALQFSALMLSKKKSASSILGQVKPYPQLLINLKIAEKKDLDKIKGLKELKKDLENKNINTLFRYSGTENLIRLLLEARDIKLLEKEMKNVVEFFKKALNG
ncbi:phosphoglucosamine mutase, partial [Campylobacter jejuni]